MSFRSRASGRFDCWRRTARLAAVQFRCCRNAVLLIGTLQICWFFLAPAIFDGEDGMLGVRMQTLSFQLAPALALMTTFLGLLQVRDAGVLGWLRSLSEDSREIVLGLSICGTFASSIFLLTGSPSIVLGLSASAPDLGWGILALAAVVTTLLTLYLLVPAVAFQLWVLLRPQRRPGWDALWIGAQLLFCALFAAVPQIGLPNDALARGAAVLAAGFTLIVAPPLVTVLFIRSASARLDRLEV